MTFHYRIVIAWSYEDNAYVASVPSLPNCKAHGKTVTEAAHEATQAGFAMLRVMRENDDEPPGWDDYDENKGFFLNKKKILEQRTRDGVRLSLGTLRKAAGVELEEMCIGTGWDVKEILRLEQRSNIDDVKVWVLRNYARILGAEVDIVLKQGDHRFIVVGSPRFLNYRQTRSYAHLTTGDAVRMVRELQEMTLEELSDASKVSVAKIVGLEKNNDEIEPDKLQKLAVALRVDARVLMMSLREAQELNRKKLRARTEKRPSPGPSPRKPARARRSS